MLAHGAMTGHTCQLVRYRIATSSVIIGHARACAHARHVPGANLNARVAGSAGDAVRRTASWVARSKCPPIGPCLTLENWTGPSQAGTGRDVAVDRQAACSAFLGLAGRTYISTRQSRVGQATRPPPPKVAHHGRGAAGAIGCMLAHGAMTGHTCQLVRYRIATSSVIIGHARACAHASRPGRQLECQGGWVGG